MDGWMDGGWMDSGWIIIIIHISSYQEKVVFLFSSGEQEDQILDDPKELGIQGRFHLPLAHLTV